MIKAVFFDIDGTLIRMDTHEIPESTLSALRQLKKNGIRLFIASGRPPVQLPLLCESFRTFPWDGYILMNGQYCTDEEHQPFFRNPIPQEAIRNLVPYLRTVDYCCTFYELDMAYDIRFNEHMYSYLREIGQESRMYPTLDPERAYTHETFQICPYIPEERDGEFLAHAPGMKSARWTAQFADMIPADGGKPEGVRRMLERFGIRQEECMAFGDGGNDISMLQFAGIGVAMGNAEERVRTCADYVTAHINDDGIEKALRHFGLLSD